MGLTPTLFYCRGPRKSRAITVLTLSAFVAYQKGETYVIINLLTVLRINVKDQNQCALEDSRRLRYSFNFGTLTDKKVH